MKIIIQHFFLGLMIAFTISVVILSAIVSVAFETASVPVTLIEQALLLSVLCSLINLVYRSEKLKFLWQSLIGYVLTVGAIMTCGLSFGWYRFGGDSQNQTTYILISFLVYSLFYLVTWLIIWRIAVVRRKELNEKLNVYKKNQLGEKVV